MYIVANSLIEFLLLQMRCNSILTNKANSLIEFLLLQIVDFCVFARIWLTASLNFYSCRFKQFYCVEQRLTASLNFYYRFTLFHQLCLVFVHVNIGEQLVLMQFLLHRFIRSAINITQLPDDYLFHSRNAMSGHYAILYSQQYSIRIFFEVILKYSVLGVSAVCIQFGGFIKASSTFETTKKKSLALHLRMNTFF